MIIDYNFLQELGLGGIPDSQKDLMIADIQEILQERIGAQADQSLSDEKRQELQDLMDRSGDDQAPIKDWLVSNLSNYDQIIRDEVARVQEEIKLQVPQILQNYSTVS